MITPFFLTKTFDPIITPKILSVLLVLFSFVVISRILELISKKHIFGAWLVLTVLAANTSFVIWTTSGLENPLYVLLISLILWQYIKLTILGGGYHSGKPVIILSILSVLCALTRPDGILYVGVFPLLVFIDWGLRNCKAKDAFKSILLYGGIFVLTFGSYMVFRYSYFREILPNTYYAKGAGLAMSPADWLVKITYLLGSIGLNQYLFSGLFILVIYLGIIKGISHYYLDLLIMLLTAILAYILLPNDWMPEFRFATPIFLLFYLFIFSTFDLVYHKAKSKTLTGFLIALLAIFFAGNSMISFFERSTNFAKSPTVPFTSVADSFGFRFNEYAAELGVKNGSILLPDIGGTLYYSNLRVYDLVGLTDKVIAKNLGKNQGVFYDYVFITLKPTFIHTHEWWAYIADFDADPRFRQDYVAIDETPDNWVLTQMGISILSGDYIRKDALENYGALPNVLTKPIEK